jgi:hypothetical protein
MDLKYTNYDTRKLILGGQIVIWSGGFRTAVIFDGRLSIR